MTVATKQFYAIGAGLGLIGSVVAVVSLILAGPMATVVPTIVAPAIFAIVLANVFRREDFEREHSVGYRIVNFCGALFTIVLGLVMLAVGIWSFGVFV